MTGGRSQNPPPITNEWPQGDLFDKGSPFYFIIFILMDQVLSIDAILSYLESMAPPNYQESYDNAGLITGSREWECHGVLTTLDATEAVVEEAVARRCNLIIAHHPIVFSGLKKINGKNYVEKAVIAAIKQDIAIYAIHTNLDNIVSGGVNGRIAAKLGLVKGRP